MLGEFDLIEKYLVGKQRQRKDVALAAGDDCALVIPPKDCHIAVTTDTLVAGTHFLPDANPAWLAHKALAANLSDLAAMGATPTWASLALTLPKLDEPWLAAFCQAFFELADYYDIQLIGGDTTKGPLAITLTVQGVVGKEQALTRHGAEPGDWIYVTGHLGDSQAGLDAILKPECQSEPFAEHLERQHFMRTPRILAGQALTRYATAAIDISDGLLADLSHILTRSEVGALLNVEQIPLSSELQEFCQSTEQAYQYALNSGEEYELCFTLPDYHREQLEQALAHTATPVTCIGQIRGQAGLECRWNDQPFAHSIQGFDHFKGHVDE